LIFRPFGGIVAASAVNANPRLIPTTVRKEDVMERAIRQCGCFAALCFFLVGSCATTTLTTVWKEQGFHRTMRKVVVIGTFRTSATRNTFEDDFVNQLKAQGVDAVASYTFISLKELPDRNLVMSRVKATGADAVLVTRLLGKQIEETYVPDERYVLPDYYHFWEPYYQYLYTPGYTAGEEYAFAETNIYDTGDNKLIWSARSETQLAGRNAAEIKSFVRAIIDRLSEDKLIGG
jgi:hypothetical protein